MMCLPVLAREIDTLPRQYVANLIYTVVGERFKQWVEQRVNERHELRRQQENTIHMDAEIALVFNASHATRGK